MCGRTWRTVLGLALVLLLGGGAARGEPGPTATTTVIQFGGSLGITYSPAIVVVAPGDTVEWRGDFSSHPLVSQEGLWPTQSSGTSFSHTFDSFGTYHFFCQIHGPFGMRGQVLVSEAVYLPLLVR